jgi:hypothetical protein
MARSALYIVFHFRIYKCSASEPVLRTDLLKGSIARITCLMPIETDFTNHLTNATSSLPFEAIWSKYTSTISPNHHFIQF